MKIYYCKHCHNVVFTEDPKEVPVCCGEPMVELVPGAVEAAHEKHIPVVSKDGNKVDVVVGSIEHPMTEAHYIEWIAVHSKKGIKIVTLKPIDKPEAHFELEDKDEVVNVYAYCNLHGLWKA